MIILSHSQEGQTEKKEINWEKFPLFGETMLASFDTENYIPRHLSRMWYQIAHPSQ